MSISSSPTVATSNSSDTEFEKFLSLGNFELAWTRVRNSKRAEVKDRLGLMAYSIDTRVYLQSLIELIAQQKYKPQRPHILYMPKAIGLSRLMPFLSMDDRVVLQAIGNIITHNTSNLIRAHAYSRLFAAIPNANTYSDFMFENSMGNEDYPGSYVRFLEAIRSQAYISDDTWIVQTDIANFYPSISHSILKHKISAFGWLKSLPLIDILMRGLAVWTTSGETEYSDCGLPIGYETSDILANLFLLEIDQAISVSDVCTLLRFNDDMALLTLSEQQAIKSLAKLDTRLQSIKLNIQGAKTSIQKYLNVAQKNDREIQFGRLKAEIGDRLQTDIAATKAFAQQELLDFLTTLLGSKKIQDQSSFELDDLLKQYDGDFAFILYRLEKKDKRAREIALKLLESTPKRSVHCIRYLSRPFWFKDAKIKKSLENIAIGSHNPPVVRGNSLRALHLLNPKKAKRIASEWLEDKDWYIRLIGTEIIGVYSDSLSNLIGIFHSSASNIQRSVALLAAYRLLNSNQERGDILYSAEESDDKLLRTIGKYLKRTDLNFRQSSYNFINTDSEHTKVTQSLDDLLPNISTALHKFTNIELDDCLPLDTVFVNANYLSELLYKLSDIQLSDQKLFFQTASEFIREFCGSVMAKLGYTEGLINFLQLKVPNIYEKLTKILAYSASISPSDERVTLFSNPVSNFVKHADYKLLVDGLKHSIALLILELYQYLNCPPPNSLKAKADQAKQDIQIQVFFSHSTKDDPLVTDLHKRFARNKIKTWIDHIELSGGTHWEPEIKSAIENCLSMVVILTNDSIDSVQVKREWKRFIQLIQDDPNRRLYPIVGKRLTSLKTPNKPLQKFHIYDLSYRKNSKMYQEELKRLIRDLKRTSKQR